MDDLPRRLRRLPRLPGTPHGLEVLVADTVAARLLGLAGLAAMPRSTGLLLPGTRSVHTVGMRFGLDLVWIAGGGRVVQVDAGVGPGRLAGCRAARCVVEFAAGGPGPSSLPRPGDRVAWPSPPARSVAGPVRSARDERRRSRPPPAGGRHRP
jgi:hypothetical protein